MESKDELLQHLADIQVWEEDQKGLFFWEKLGRLPFKLLDKVTPKFIQEKIGILVNELGSYIQTGGKYLISEKAIIKKIRKTTVNIEIETIEDVANMPLKDMIKVSNELQVERVKFATVQGATTGFGGIFTLVVDIPVVLGTALKTLQEIAIIHGYNPNEKTERVFIVKCMQFASADIVGKEAILKELATMNEKKSSSEDMISQLKGWQEVFFTYRDQFGWKKLFQMIPIAGMVFGAFANKGMIKDVSEAGIMLYRKRRIYEKLHEIEISTKQLNE
ncbi:EcsC family protein [Ureibacillus sp. MALMAid1270]|uniref:EcsC family protein n=1 Tax=Ureibacillus sp. MALMAid1270 TaxID=3411629 RepID=UPI003BA67AEE